MAGEENLNKLLDNMQPCLLDGEYVFSTLQDSLSSVAAELNPLASFQEAEGLSLIVQKDVAEQAGLEYTTVFRAITLNIHSGLEAVGFTAAIATKLADNNISANVVAAHYHDHLLVPADRADEAVNLLSDTNFKSK